MERSFFFLTMWVEMWTSADFLESCLASALTSGLSSDLGMSPIVRRALEGKDTRTQVFIAAPHVKKVNRGMVYKILYIHTMEYYTVILKY